MTRRYTLERTDFIGCQNTSYMDVDDAEPWPCRADEQQAAWAGSVMCYIITCNTRQGGATWPPRSHQ